MRQYAARIDDGKTAIDDTTRQSSAGMANAPANTAALAPYSFEGMNVFAFTGGIVSGEVVNPLPPIDRGAVVLFPSIALGYEVKGGPTGTPVFVGKDGVTFELQTLVNTISYKVDPQGKADAISFSSKVPGLPRTSISVGVEGVNTVTWSTSTDVATYSDGKRDFSGTIQLTLRVKMEPKQRQRAPEPVPQRIPILDPEMHRPLIPPSTEEIAEKIAYLLAILAAAYLIAVVIELLIALVLILLLLI